MPLEKSRKSPRVERRSEEYSNESRESAEHHHDGGRRGQGEQIHGIQAEQQASARARRKRFDHSDRNVSAGSIRRTGVAAIKLAPTATQNSNTPAARYVSVSVDVTPKRKGRSASRKKRAAPAPAAMPASASTAFS